MALADYFHRDAVAISQVLQGFETAAFVEALEKVRIAVAFDEEAADSRDGRYLLEVSVRLLARLYPSLAFATGTSGMKFAAELSELARSINPNIETPTIEETDLVLAVGADAPTFEMPTIYAGCDGWQARVGTIGPYRTSNLGNPFGAGFAACIAVANMFRLLFFPDGASLVDNDVRFPKNACEYPGLTPTTVQEPIVLVGIGAVGNSAAWALARAPIAGQIHLVDPEAIELGNIQRYILSTRSDEGNSKVNLVDNEFQGPLRSTPHDGSWASFVTANGYTWERVLVALDSARDRRAVQGSLPRWIVNAWTQVGDLGVSTHVFLGHGACLACLYLPTETSKNEDQIMAEGLKIPELQNDVRNLLGNGQATGRALCGAIADAWGISRGLLEPYVDRPIRELWVEGVCGGGVLPLGTVGESPREVQVPLAFQSALAGLILAAETVRDVLTGGVHRKSLVRRLDVTRPIGDASRQPVLTAGTGRCMCEDSDFVETYRTKYES